MNTRLSVFAAMAAMASVPSVSFAYPMERGCLPASPGHMAICPGDSVMSRTNADNIGTVRTVFSNGEVMVDMLSGYFARTVQGYRADQLAVEVQGIGGIVPRATVMSITNHDNVGTVSHVYEHGMTIVRMSTGYFANTDQSYSVNNLAYSVPRMGEVMVNDLVISRSNSSNTGTVMAVFSNGVAQVRMTTGYFANTIQTYEVTNLAVNLGPRRGTPPVGGQVVCSVKTQLVISRGLRPYMGVGASRDEASRNARRACMNMETPFECNRDSYITCNQ
jgi:hypothetical protein